MDYLISGLPQSGDHGEQHGFGFRPRLETLKGGPGGDGRAEATQISSQLVSMHENNPARVKLQEHTRDVHPRKTDRTHTSTPAEC